MKLGRGKSEAASRPIELPGLHEVVALTTGTGESLPARVLERGVNTVLVAITVPIEPLSAQELEDLVLEFTGPHGRVRLRGPMRLENPAETDVLRLEDPRSIEVLQQREYVRVMASRPVLVYSAKDHFEIESYTVDVSGGGFLLAGPDTLKVGDRVQFRLALGPDLEPVSGTAKVLRVDSRGRRAAIFEEISEPDRRRLIRFIFDCQRDERQRGLEHDG